MGGTLESRSRLTRAFSLIEALICGSVLGVAIIAVAGPLSQNLQGAAMSERCKRNLGRLGQLSAMVSMQGRLNILHPESTNGPNAWRGLGAWDWGGADGACGETNSTWPTSPYHLGASTRPFNRFLYGEAVPANADYALFQCPADTGTDPGALYRAEYFDTEPCSAEQAEEVAHKSVFLMQGNSYQGDFISYPFGSWSVRFGSFLRPAEMFPAPSEVILFGEHRFMQAILSTTEAVQQGIVSGTPTRVQSWHSSDGRFNLAHADGHVQSVDVNVTGSLLNPDSMPSAWRVRLRGQTWRYDAYPDVELFEAVAVPNPILDAPTGDGVRTCRWLLSD